MWAAFIKQFWPVVPTLMLSLAIGWYVLAANNDSWTLAEQKAVSAKEASMTQQCNDDKKTTTEVSHAYQIQLSALNDQLAALKRVRRPISCIRVSSPGSAPGRDATARPGQSVDEDGVRADALLDFAAEAEQYRLRLLGCQDFVRKTWAANGQ